MADLARGEEHGLNEELGLETEVSSEVVVFAVFGETKDDHFEIEDRMGVCQR